MNNTLYQLFRHQYQKSLNTLKHFKEQKAYWKLIRNLEIEAGLWEGRCKEMEECKK